MNLYIVGLALAVVTLAFGCSGVKTKFNEKELKWMNIYNEGDTLIFKSDKEDFDTSYIIKKELYYSSYNSIEKDDKYLPQQGIVWYKNKKLKYHPDGYRLIDITKKHPNKRTSLAINYLYSSVIIPNLVDASIQKTKKGKIYDFNVYHPKAEPEQPKEIFWHEDYGIVKYVTHDGLVWERINLSK